jgi:hypothetical protein
MEAQGQTYKPFISAEVTKALKLNQEANSQILNILSKFAGPSGGIMDLGQKESPTENQSQMLTVENALSIIQSQPNHIPLLEDPEAKENLYMEYSIGDMPEVNATRQINYDTSKEGLGIKDLTLLGDDVEEDDHHSTRREKQLGIDMDIDQI